jgi:hypothetical protein
MVASVDPKRHMPESGGVVCSRRPQHVEGGGEGWPLAVGFGSVGGKEVGGDRGVGEREEVRGDKGSDREGGGQRRQGEPQRGRRSEETRGATERGEGCGLVWLGDG